VTTDPLILVRGVHFAATLLAAGTTGFIWLVAKPAAGKTGFATLHRHLTVWVWLALAAAVMSGASWLVLLASDVLGTSIADVCLHGGALALLADTRFGLVWSIRLALALSLALLLPWPVTRWFQITIAAAFLILPAFVGHAGATPGPAGDLDLVSDMVHLLAAGAWLGGLPAFTLLVWRARRRTGRDRNRSVVRVVDRFSKLGIFSVGTLLASGLVNSWSLLNGPRDLMASDYGRLIALKIILFAAMVAIAAVNKFNVTPRLPESAALRALRRNSLAEICLGLFVLAFVAMLGTLPPSVHVHVASTGIPPDAAFTHIHTSEVMADVTIEPGRTGRTDVTIRVSREDSSSYPAKDVRLELDSPAAGGQTIKRAAIEQPDGSWLVNDLTLAPSGIWATRVIVRPGSGDAIVLDAPIVIER
jgi:putative copper resistance protein D